jgi:hypothetical protein
MTIGELADKMDNQNDLAIEFWDENMHMMRNIEQADLQRFIDQNFNRTIQSIHADRYFIKVRLT